MPSIDITIQKDGDRWIASAADSGTYESGVTDLEALGKLMLSHARVLGVSISRLDPIKPVKKRTNRKTGRGKPIAY